MHITMNYQPDESWQHHINRQPQPPWSLTVCTATRPSSTNTHFCRYL